ncbi:MAG: RagB/SusD family nutrient uptake outer membrane protein [Flavobacterium sp.]|nr:MAG: RagB/SusD family nutrient uptake outer membrane protein [Flavobacterium sp.]
MKKIFPYLIIGLLILCNGCKKDFLKEEPRDNTYAENLLVNYTGFKTMTVALQGLMRHEYRRVDAFGGFSSLPLVQHSLWSSGVDNSWSNNSHSSFKFMYYPKYIDQPDAEIFKATFEWLYRIVTTANMIISRAEAPSIDWSGGSKEEIVATARFYRAWAYRHLTYSFGAVPLATEEITGLNYRKDWDRNSVAEIRAVMEQDLLYAVANLPMRAKNNTLVSGALARHYLGELYLAMDKYNEAKTALQPLVEGTDYRLMTSRFGSNAANPGCSFIDVFRSPFYSQGNMEVLYAFVNTEPEVESHGTSAIYIKSTYKNYYSNDAVIKQSNQQAPEVVNGTVTLPQMFWLVNGGKGAGRCVPSLGAIRLYNYKGQGNTDDRVSNYSMVWKIYEKNASSNIVEFLRNGKSPIDTTLTAAMIDDNRTTIQNYKWPSTRKWDYTQTIASRGDADESYADVSYLRLADTYLLYAETLYRLGDVSAVNWINKVRNRSNAVSITAADLSAEGIDLILDERSRELLSEEERRHTLVRVSQENGGDERDVNNFFKRRTRKYNEISGRPVRGMNDYETPILFPLPQDFINSNSGRALKQNPGYH